MNELVVIDYSTGTVDVWKVDRENIDEEFVVNLGFRLKDIAWIFGTMGVNVHKEVLT